MKLIEKVQSASDEGKVIFSFEYHPPRQSKGQTVDTFLNLVRRMVGHGPAFCDMTWGAGGSTAGLTLELSGRMQNDVGIDTMMHLTVLNMTMEEVDSALDAARSCGIENILALKGDPPIGQEETFVQVPGGLECALDLVKHIKAKHGDYFGIVVAGYPEAHPCKIPKGSEVATEEGYKEDLIYLKKKIDAGGDLIITQLFYDTDIFLKFVDDCRAIGITCPIIPGILPITTYLGYKRMTQVCKTKIPSEIKETLESIKDDKQAVKAYGIKLGTEMCKKILDHGIKTLHFYTMNTESSVLAILRNLGLVAPAETYVPMALAEKQTKEEGEAVSGVPQAVFA